MKLRVLFRDFGYPAKEKVHKAFRESGGQLDIVRNHVLKRTTKNANLDTFVQIMLQGVQGGGFSISDGAHRLTKQRWLGLSEQRLALG
jgi:hypothetical protein